MKYVWVKGKLLRIQGKRRVHVIRFDNKSQPVYISQELIADTDVEKEGESGLFRLPEWLVAKEELLAADVYDASEE